MATELCGAKLLAPFFGSSLQVWASVLGITLFALAVGYFYGGTLTNMLNAENKLFYVLTGASAFTVLTPLIANYLLPYLSLFPLAIGVVCGSLLLIFPALFFLGTSSPLFVLLQSSAVNAGKAGGTVYAMSTFGGIIATFLCGFFLIPNFGLTFTLLFFGILLFVSSTLLLKVVKINSILLVLILVIASFSFTKENSNRLNVQDGILGKLEVYEEKTDSGVLLRKFSINRIVQTEMNLITKKSVSEYLNLLDTLIIKEANSKKALVLGLGGGLTSNMLVEKNYKVDAVEFDERIIDVAKKYFSLDKNVVVFCDDARFFLNKSKSKYDLILVDVFKAEEQPNHVLTKESLMHLKNNLTDSAIIYINWHGYIDGEIGLGTHVLLNTLQISGFKTQVMSNNLNPDARNLMIKASLNQLNKNRFEINYSSNSSNKKINTDDLPLLEFYNRQANLTWRKNYLKYYNSKL